MDFLFQMKSAVVISAPGKFIDIANECLPAVLCRGVHNHGNALKETNKKHKYTRVEQKDIALVVSEKQKFYRYTERRTALGKFGIYCASFRSFRNTCDDVAVFPDLFASQTSFGVWVVFAVPETQLSSSGSDHNLSSFALIRRPQCISARAPLLGFPLQGLVPCLPAFQF